MSQADEDYENDRDICDSQRIRDCVEREMESDGRIIDSLRQENSSLRAKVERMREALRVIAEDDACGQHHDAMAREALEVK